MPRRRAVLMMRQAISPRLAIRMRLNIGRVRAPTAWARGMGAFNNTVLFSPYPLGHTVRTGEMTMLPRLMILATAAIVGSTLGAAAQTTAQPPAAQAPHNLILFVPDGLRAQIVTP